MNVIIFLIGSLGYGALELLFRGWNVWNYSLLPGNILGQICPLFTLLWFLLCLTLAFVSKGLKKVSAKAEHSST